MLLPCVCVACCVVSGQIYSRIGLESVRAVCVCVCDGSKQVRLCVCMWLPTQPGEEFRVRLASEGKVSQWLVTLLASDQNRMRKCQRTEKKNSHTYTLCMTLLSCEDLITPNLEFRWSPGCRNSSQLYLRVLLKTMSASKVKTHAVCLRFYTKLLHYIYTSSFCIKCSSHHVPSELLWNPLTVEKHQMH